jgi:hypothetical protein
VVFVPVRLPHPEVPPSQDENSTFPLRSYAALGVMSGAAAKSKEKGYCDTVQPGVTSAFKTGLAGLTEAGHLG